MVRLDRGTGTVRHADRSSSSDKGGSDMRVTLRWAAAALVLLAGPAARADDVLPGIDMFQTLACGSGVDPTQVIPGGIPPNFFDPGSDPYTTPISLTGQPPSTATPR